MLNCNCTTRTAILLQLMLAVLEINQTPTKASVLRQAIFDHSPHFTDEEILMIINKQSSESEAIRNLIVRGVPKSVPIGQTEWPTYPLVSGSYRETIAEPQEQTYCRGTATWPHFRHVDDDEPELLNTVSVAVSDAYGIEDQSEFITPIVIGRLGGFLKTSQEDIDICNVGLDHLILQTLDELGGDQPQGVMVAKESVLIAHVLFKSNHITWIPQYLQIKNRLKFLVDQEKLVVSARADGFRMFNHYRLAY